jgi:hypothetical protein
MADTHQMIKRLVPPIALWIATKILETPKIKEALEEVDSRVYVGKRKASRAVQRVTKNAVNRPAYLVAGAVAFVIGIGLMAKAAGSKK